MIASLALLLDIPYLINSFSNVFLQTNETRSVTQLQYSLWPDHGVPDDSDRLLNLVGAVRKERAGVVEPVVIHCSAGIGRTGVIILLETALCLIEAGQPVYPLEIVRQMRDQRAMMVQTSVSTI